MRACCPGEHPGEECWRCPYEETDVWPTASLVRACSTKVNAKDEPPRWAPSLEALRLVYDHPELFNVEDTLAARDDIYWGIAMLNGDE